MKLLINAAKELGFKINETQLECFSVYMKNLLEWNEKINLTAITNLDDIIIKHFIDSLTLLGEIPNDKCIKLADIGTGAGFPGVPLKIMRPDIKLTLMDSLNKRIVFLEHLTHQLNLNDVKCVHIRAENAGHIAQHREQYDICTARAVTNLSALAEYCLPLTKIGGKFISMKGPDAENEVLAAKSAIYKLGGSISEIKTVNLPFTNIYHTLVIINKLSQTSVKFPRNQSKITKSPIV